MYGGVCQAAGVNVVPLPEKVELQNGASFKWAADTTVSGGDLQVVKLAAELLHTRAVADKGSIQLSLAGAADSLGDEGYDLRIDEHQVIIKATTPAGLFYGVQTLRQMLVGNGELSAVHIVDRPRFGYRGLMLDSCRHIQTVSYIKTFLDRMAELKMNRFHWHLTEDQGWRIEIKKYPKLTEIGAWREKDGQRYGGIYSQDQIREVVAYAEARFITVIPEIEMPGHSTAAVASYPWLGCTGQQIPVRWEWGVSPHVYDPAKASTITFCQDVLLETMDLFPHSPIIHIGGDECPKDDWKADPDCQAMIKKLGLKNEDALQGYFTSQIAHFLESHGRRLQGWNEIMRDSDLPKNVIVQSWNSPRSVTQAAEAGLDVVNSLTSHCYFDYPYQKIPISKVLQFEPIPKTLSKSAQAHILGLEGELWTEHLEDGEAVDRMAFPRAVALAEVGWSARGEKDWADFQKRLTGWLAEQSAEQHKIIVEQLASDPANKP